MPYRIYCAANNTPDELKKKADFICDTIDARPTIQKAVNKADELGVSCVLFPGTYEINSCGEDSPKGAICFRNPYPKDALRKHITYYSTVEGVKAPFLFRGGAIITLGKDFYDSLPDDEEFSIFYNEGHKKLSHGMFLKNIGVQLPGNYKPVIAFDGSCSNGLRYEDCWASAVDLDTYYHPTSEGVDIPNALSVGFRGCHGSNAYTTEWKNLATLGFGTGFAIGGEHVYCESLSAYHGIYGFTFDCYKGKFFIDESEEEPPRGVGIYPVVCVNLLDEHNIHMPRFGNMSHHGKSPDESIPPDDRTPEGWHKSITITGMNIQWPNTCPGRTDRLAPDFTDGRQRVTEDQPGSWHGRIEFVVDHSLPGHGVNVCKEPFFEEGSGINIEAINHREIENVHK